MILGSFLHRKQERSEQKNKWETEQGLVNVPLCFTSPNYWGYKFQQIFEGDVKQIPQQDIYQPLLNTSKSGVCQLWKGRNLEKQKHKKDPFKKAMIPSIWIIINPQYIGYNVVQTIMKTIPQSSPFWKRWYAYHSQSWVVNMAVFSPHYTVLESFLSPKQERPARVCCTLLMSIDPKPRLTWLQHPRWEVGIGWSNVKSPKSWSSYMVAGFWSWIQWESLRSVCYMVFHKEPFSWLLQSIGNTQCQPWINKPQAAL